MTLLLIFVLAIYSFWPSIRFSILLITSYCQVKLPQCSIKPEQLRTIRPNQPFLATLSRPSDLADE